MLAQDARPLEEKQASVFLRMPYARAPPCHWPQWHAAL